MSEELEQITIAIEGTVDSDDVELDDMTARLRQRILSLDVESVDRVRGRAPLGARSTDAATIGALAITVSPGLVRAVVGLVEAWRRSSPVRRVTVSRGRQRKLVLEGASPADLSKALEAFLSDS